MTGSEVALIITAAGTFLTSLGSVVIAVKNAAKIEKVHIATNSMKDALVAASHKDGVAVGRALEKEQGGHSSV